MTYEDASLHTRRYSGTLEDNIHLTYAVDLADGLCGLLGDCQILVDVFSSLHWHKVACMSETILYRKVQPSLINIGNDNLLRTFDLRNSRAQQAHSSGTVYNHSRILGHQATPESM
jgi:hypothetical protein